MKAIPTYKFRYKSEDKIPFEILRIEENPFLSRSSAHPRRDSFYILFRITSGVGEYYIDFNRYEIKPNSLFFIAPGQVHYWKIDQPIHGDAILFENNLFLRYGQDTFLQELALFDIFKSARTLYLPAKKVSVFERHIELLYREYMTKDFKRREMLVSLLKIFLIEAQREMPISDPGGTHTAGQRLTRQFLDLVKQQVTEYHSPKAYAEELGVTPGHLTETVKKNLGVTTGELLRQRLALEIKRWLVHSDLTASQIAEKLNFSDISYFGRFFKRETGKSPNAFRKEFHEKYQESQL